MWSYAIIIWRQTKMLLSCKLFFKFVFSNKSKKGQVWVDIFLLSFQQFLDILQLVSFHVSFTGNFFEMNFIVLFSIFVYVKKCPGIFIRRKFI